MSNQRGDKGPSAEAAAGKERADARARDAKLAMAEYLAEGRAQLAKTAPLRALRLARDAGEPPPDEKKDKAGRAKRGRP
jgi:hypothetical protein